MATALHAELVLLLCHVGGAHQVGHRVAVADVHDVLLHDRACNAGSRKLEAVLSNTTTACALPATECGATAQPHPDYTSLALQSLETPTGRSTLSMQPSMPSSNLNPKLY